MKLIAIDTATEACSVAALLDGEIVERYEVAGREHSSRLPIMLQALLAETGLGLSQFDALVCGVGPGSFAGVRIGVSFVKGLALGLDLPVLGVSSLAMLAQGAHRQHAADVVLAAIDARMGEVYFGRYQIDRGFARLEGTEIVCAPSAVPPLGETATSVIPAQAGSQLVTECDGQKLDSRLRGNDDGFERFKNSQLIGAGSGWNVYADALTAALGITPQHIDPLALPHARDALTLATQDFAAGKVQSAASLVPVYLRDRVALTQLEQSAACAARLAPQ